MSIRKNIERVMEKIQAENAQIENSEIQNAGSVDPAARMSETGKLVRRKAVAAIKSGEGTPAWEEYMKMFAEDDCELARLLPSDATKDVFEMDVARTYLVGNGTCGAETTGFHLIEGVEDTLDEGLDTTAGQPV
jgi:hypothetical protein